MKQKEQWNEVRASRSAEGISAMIRADDEAPAPIQEIALTATPSNGNTTHFILHIYFDPESNHFWAVSPDIDGLCVEGENLKELQSNARAVAELLLELQYDREAKSKPELISAVSDGVDLLLKD